MFNKHTYKIIAVIVSVIACFSVYSYQDKEGWLNRGIMNISSPIQSSAIYFLDGIGSIWNGYFALAGVKSELEELKEINRFMVLQLANNKTYENENIRLRRLLNFTKQHTMRYKPARVISSDILGQFKTITINLGSSDGIRDSYPVVNEDGVIGNVYKVYSSSSKVLLLIDSNSSIDGRVRRTRAKGIVQGINDDERLICQFAFSLRTADVQVGDEIVTSGLDQRFPQGLVMGNILKVSNAEVGIFKEALIRPAVNFTKLSEVLIILPGDGR